VFYKKKTKKSPCENKDLGFILNIYRKFTNLQVLKILQTSDILLVAIFSTDLILPLEMHLSL